MSDIDESNIVWFEPPERPEDELEKIKKERDRLERRLADVPQRSSRWFPAIIIGIWLTIWIVGMIVIAVKNGIGSWPR